MKKTIYLLTITFLAIACGKNSDLVLREETNDLSEIEALETYLNIPTWGLLSYDRKLPSYLRNLGMKAPQFSGAKATLGRVLFYDKNLSYDRSVSCASCHKQDKAFSDDVAFSTGIAGRKTARNSLPLGNVANFAAHYQAINGLTPLLFWDARANSVPTQSRQTLANPNEMGMEMPQVMDRIHEQPYYSYLWKQAYGDFQVTEDRVLESLAEFVGAIGSYDSKLDKALEKASGDLNVNGGDTTVTISNLYYNTDTTITITLILNESEDRGRSIFVENCTKCHSPIRPFQEVFEACNGLEMNYTDQGMGTLQGNTALNGVFKSPSLRNIALTAPYMHDGRFQTLEEVVGFYNTEVKNHPNLHAEMKINGSAKRLNLTPQQKQDLVAFLHTLTDNSVAGDERFSNPFK